MVQMNCQRRAKTYGTNTTRMRQNNRGNGQVERMNRTIKDATVHRYYYQSHEQLQAHLDTFLCAYNFAKRLKTLNGMTPYQFIVKSWDDNPDAFLAEPDHLNLGLYI